MKQREMAHLLDVPETRLSEILRGKRRVNLEMAKPLRTKLKIDADFFWNGIKQPGMGTTSFGCWLSHGRQWKPCPILIRLINFSSTS